MIFTQLGRNHYSLVCDLVDDSRYSFTFRPKHKNDIIVFFYLQFINANNWFWIILNMRIIFILISLYIIFFICFALFSVFIVKCVLVTFIITIFYINLIFFLMINSISCFITRRYISRNHFEIIDSFLSLFKKLLNKSDRI